MHNHTQIRHDGDPHGGPCVTTQNYVVLSAVPGLHNAARVHAVSQAARDIAEEGLFVGALLDTILPTAQSVVVLHPRELFELSSSRCAHPHAVRAFSVIDAKGALHEGIAYVPHTEASAFVRRQLSHAPPNTISGVAINGLFLPYEKDIAYTLPDRTRQALQEMLWAAHSVEARRKNEAWRAKYDGLPNFHLQAAAETPEGYVPNVVLRSSIVETHAGWPSGQVAACPPRFRVYKDPKPAKDGSERVIGWADFGKDFVLVLFALGMTGLDHFHHKTIVYLQPPRFLNHNQTMRLGSSVVRRSLLSLPHGVVQRILAYPASAFLMDPERPGTVLVAMQRPHKEAVKHARKTEEKERKTSFFPKL